MPGPQGVDVDPEAGAQAGVERGLGGQERLGWPTRPPPASAPARPRRCRRRPGRRRTSRGSRARGPPGCAARPGRARPRRRRPRPACRPPRRHAARPGRRSRPAPAPARCWPAPGRRPGRARSRRRAPPWPGGPPARPGRPRGSGWPAGPGWPARGPGGCADRPAGGQGRLDLGEQLGVAEGGQPRLLGPLLGRRGLRAGVGGGGPEGAVEVALQRGQAVGEPPQHGVGVGRHGGGSGRWTVGRPYCSAMRYRYVVRIGPQDVGQRVVVRWRRPAAGGGDEVADVVGPWKPPTTGTSRSATAAASWSRSPATAPWPPRSSHPVKVVACWS